MIRVEAALTCGTDAKTYRRGHPVLLGPPPAPFGHEYAGTVLRAGPGAPFRSGERVAGANSAPCGACRTCRRGAEPLCENLFPLLNGAYAEELLVPARIAAVNVHRLRRRRRQRGRRDVRAAGLRAARRRGQRGACDGDRIVRAGPRRARAACSAAALERARLRRRARWDGSMRTRRSASTA